MAKEKKECSFCGRKPETNLLIAELMLTFVINVSSRHTELFEELNIR
jgi:hypothetical protein